MVFEAAIYVDIEIEDEAEAQAVYERICSYIASLDPKGRVTLGPRELRRVVSTHRFRLGAIQKQSDGSTFSGGNA